MQTVTQCIDLVNLLRGGYATEDAQCFCQCGKFCPNRDACAPVRGEVHQPYWTLRERATANGRAWAGCLYDPQATRYIVHTLFARWYPTPCQAVDVLAEQAVRTQQYPIRLDLAGAEIELVAIEQRLAQRLYDAGYALFLEQVATPDLRHPLLAAGYQTAKADAEAAIADKDPGFSWDLTAPSAVSWNSDANYVPFQHPAEAYVDVRVARDRSDHVGD